MPVASSLTLTTVKVAQCLTLAPKRGKAWLLQRRWQ